MGLARTNQVTTFTVLAKDSSGARRSTGGDKLTVEAKEGKLAVSVTDNQDGTYVVSYRTRTPVQLAVLLRGSHIGHSSFLAPFTARTMLSLTKNLPICALSVVKFVYSRQSI